jgi:hypothetical protein
MFDTSFFVALAIALAGLGLLLLVQLYLPLRRARAINLELQSARIVVRRGGGGEPGTFREWELPPQVNRVLEGLRRELAAVPGTQPPRLQEGRLILPGRPLRFLNVNRVNPLDFREAQFRIRSTAGPPNALVVQVDFGGFWRALAVVLLFTAWGVFIVRISSPRHGTFVGITVVLVLFALIFLAVHYFSHQLATCNLFDELVLRAVRSTSTSPSGAV